MSLSVAQRAVILTGVAALIFFALYIPVETVNRDFAEFRTRFYSPIWYFFGNHSTIGGKVLTDLIFVEISVTVLVTAALVLILKKK